MKSDLMPCDIDALERRQRELVCNVRVLGECGSHAGAAARRRQATRRRMAAAHRVTVLLILSLFAVFVVALALSTLPGVTS